MARHSKPRRIKWRVRRWTNQEYRGLVLAWRLTR